MDNHKKYLNHFTESMKNKDETTKYFIDKESVLGNIIRCELEKGIEMIFFDYQVKKRYEVSGFASGNILELFYCLSGNITIEYDGDKTVLKENMIGIYDFESCPQKVILEHGKIKGISLLLDADLADEVIKRYLREDIFIISLIRGAIQKNRKVFLAFGNKNIRAVFLGISESPFDYEREYLLLKALELVLISNKSLLEDRLNGYSSRKKMYQYGLYEKALKYMKKNLSLPITTKEVASKIGITERQLNQYFLEYTNQTAYSYLKHMRLNKARQLLIDTEISITEIAGVSGWQNPSKFSAAFKTKYGLTPKEFRKGN